MMHITKYFYYAGEKSSLVKKKYENVKIFHSAKERDAYVKQDPKWVKIKSTQIKLEDLNRLRRLAYVNKI